MQNRRGLAALSGDRGERLNTHIHVGAAADTEAGEHDGMVAGLRGGKEAI